MPPTFVRWFLKHKIEGLQDFCVFICFHQYTGYTVCTFYFLHYIKMNRKEEFDNYAIHFEKVMRLFYLTNVSNAI